MVLGAVAASRIRKAPSPGHVVRPKDNATYRKSDSVEPPSTEIATDSIPRHVYSSTELMTWGQHTPTGMRIV
jgi:hypothetical protein